MHIIFVAVPCRATIKKCTYIIWPRFPLNAMHTARYLYYKLVFSGCVRVFCLSWGGGGGGGGGGDVNILDAIMHVEAVL